MNGQQSTVERRLVGPHFRQPVEDWTHQQPRHGRGGLFQTGDLLRVGVHPCHLPLDPVTGLPEQLVEVERASSSLGRTHRIAETGGFASPLDLAERIQAPTPPTRATDALRIEEKCEVAECYDNSDVIAESWLVISAGLPRPGAVVATMIVPGLVKSGELNALSHGILSASRFHRAFLVLHMGSQVFGWNRHEGWRLVADPDGAERERHRNRKNHLVFTQIPTLHR